MEYQRFIPEGWYDTKEEFTIEKIINAKNNGKVIQGMVCKCDDNLNLHVKLGKDIYGIVPREEAYLDFANKDGQIKENVYKRKVNDFIQFKVKEITNDEIVLSRKDACEEACKWCYNELKSGTVVNGIVKNIKPYGVFVEIGGGMIGLIHIQDISVSRMKNPSERFFVGQKIKTVIKSVDRENSKVILSYKELLRRLG